ncbi:helix-turn-helix domain-containing protein [Pedobacter sp. L105]|uniref:helix-turn-helix domain-containing protein n=1 Tax=Pedobacter sp. L105 TaxID=1641871 RepID=UPI00131CDA41|nr:helix-turn-helix transcriptional regulator [Pedobacter sp. L105]
MQEILSKKILGERIRSLRIEKAYAQAYVADFLNLSRSNYSQIELGNQYPSFSTLNALSKHYDKSYEWLLHGVEDTQNEPKIKPFETILQDLESSLKNFSASLKQLENELQHIKKTLVTN